jgi:3',5'-cyclic AMP phosphodiesterase CpdA
MPIHLPPLTRRHFVASTAAGLLGIRTLRAAAPTDEPSWALLADPHIAADRTTVSRGAKVADKLAATVKEVLALRTLPANVLINGDCALKLGFPGDYATFADLVKPLREAGMTLHLTLGNHDDRAAFRKALETQRPAERPIADRNVAIVRTARANFFLLDSLDVVDVAPGRLGDSQVSWLARQLDANADKPAIVCVHHNLNDARAQNGLVDTKAVLAVLELRKQVKAYVFGHTHVWSVKEHASGIHLVNLPATGYPFAPAQPTGWVHCTLTEKGANLKLSSLEPKHAAHGQTVELKWRGG